MRGIADGCAAALDGRIKIHDQIIAVCSVCVVKHIHYTPFCLAASVLWCIFSLGLCFAYLFVLFDLFVSPILLCFLGQLRYISLTGFGAGVTNLNELLEL